MNAEAFAEVSAAFPWFFPAVVLVFGACIGSFLNVVIYRLPAGQSIVRPGSHCACGAPVAWHDNIPILSWFILRGRARCCGRPYSFRYAFVELLTALLFVASWFKFSPAEAACGMIFLSGLVAATFIDLDHFIIPDVFTIGGAIVGVALSIAVPALHDQAGDVYLLDAIRSGVSSLTGVLVGSGIVLWLAVLAEAALKKEAMGFGDVKLAGAIGAFCGWQGAVFALFGGAIVGVIWVGCALIWQKVSGRPAALAPKTETPEGGPAPLGFGVHVPFGPMLAIAAAAHFLFLRDLISNWFGEFAALL